MVGLIRVIAVFATSFSTNREASKSYLNNKKMESLNRAFSFILHSVALTIVLSSGTTHASNLNRTVQSQAECHRNNFNVDSQSKSPLKLIQSQQDLDCATASNQQPTLKSAHILGRIVSVTGTAIENAVITALDHSGVTQTVVAQSNSSGEFSIALDADTQYVLQLTAPEFSTQVIPVLSSSTNTSYRLNNIVMAERGEAHSINVDGKRTILANDGANVTFDKANFVDINGQPLLDEMQLTITPLDISNTRSIKAFPGLFLGVSPDNITPEMIVNLGAVEYHFTHNGEPVNLASGATADIQIPIYVNQYPNGKPIEAGDTIPLRSLNETTGVWSQEGTGTVVYSTDSPTGLAYQATVSHFSWWGADVAVSTPEGDTSPNTGVASTIITINAPAGIKGFAVIEATAPDLVNWRGDTVSVNLSVGDSTPALDIPANRDVCFNAYLYFSSGTTSVTNEVCVNVASQAIVNLYIELGQTGPIDVTVSPQLNDDTAFIQGFVNVQSPALRIAATTIETTITYQLLSGSLPAGLSLDVFDNVLNLVGVPTIVGEETFVIRATDSDGNVDDINVTYNVSSLSPPPIIEDDSDRFFVGEITTLDGSVQVNLNDIVSNIGGPIAQWQEVSSGPDQDQCNSMYSNAGIKGASADLNLPTSVTLNSTTGQIRFNSEEVWLSCLKAVNDQGSAVFLFGFEIINVSPPPIILQNTDRFFSGEITTPGGTVQVNLNDLVSNIGGPITQWQEISSLPDQNQCINMYSNAGVKGASADLSLPTSTLLNNATGQLTFNSAEFFLSCLKAVNSQGASVFLFGFEITDITQ